ncbi:MAG: hypothetical protein ABIR62_10725 [Dokdonella sp.]|uniref:hypothetical protein n=1 Tax=Dokdonella sp. TaxID=2291710 RepID=UPI003265FB6D
MIPGRKPAVLLALLAPSAALAESQAGFAGLVWLLCVPSFLLFGACAYILWLQATLATPNTLFVVLAPVALLPLGLVLTEEAVPVPLWAMVASEPLSFGILWQPIACVVLVHAIYAARRFSVISARTSKLDAP